MSKEGNHVQLCGFTQTSHIFTIVQRGGGGQKLIIGIIISENVDNYGEPLTFIAEKSEEEVVVLRGDIKDVKEDVEEEVVVLRGDIQDVKEDVVTVQDGVIIMRGDVENVQEDMVVMKGDIQNVKANINALDMEQPLALNKRGTGLSPFINYQ